MKQKNISSMKTNTIDKDKKFGKEPSIFSNSFRIGTRVAINQYGKHSEREISQGQSFQGKYYYLDHAALQLQFSGVLTSPVP